MKRVLLALVLFVLQLAPTHAATTLAKVDPLTVLLVPSPGLSAQDYPDLELTRTSQALQDWVNKDVVGVWSLPPVIVHYVLREAKLPPARPHQWVLNLRTFCDYGGCAGYHARSYHDIPYGEIGLSISDMFFGHWSVVASHELAEMLVDPYVNRLASNGGGTKAWNVEVGDPVETTSYLFGDRGHAYWMSDIVYPSFYDSTGRYPFDKLHLVKAPFKFLPGGYMIFVKTGPGVGVQ